MINKLIQCKHILLVLCLLQSTSLSADIYKYQDQHGKWHFSDKKPDDSSTSVKRVNYLSSEIKQIKPFLEMKQANGMLNYVANNPMLISVQCFLIDKNTQKKISMLVLKPISSETIFEQKNSMHKLDVYFKYVVGDPETKPAISTIIPPFIDFKPMKIGQSFNGKFSHYRKANLYAVDIGMPVGTKIVAVKEGIVIRTKDDYAHSGVTSPFFFDKANLVEILHADGTYAVYAHLLLGGVHVKVGDKVSTGQVIGLSGNTGYSTGPHLHFVIRYNDNGKVNSVPFKFLQPGKKQITPEQGGWLLPYLPK